MSADARGELEAAAQRVPQATVVVADVVDSGTGPSTQPQVVGSAALRRPAKRVDTSPAARAAARVTHNGRIGLIATQGTVDSRAYADALEAYRHAARQSHLKIIGIDCHIGSQLTTVEPFLDALDRLLALIDRLATRGIQIRHLDLGGGLGVRYRDEQPPLAGDYIQAVRQRIEGRGLALVFEPGRSIVANAGLLLTRVEYLKHTAHKDFAIVDAAMNDLIRPALYQAWMDVQAVRPRDAVPRRYDLVGPICETGDFLAKDRDLALAEGDLLAVRSAGAYGFVMSSNYNTRGRAAEVLVDGDQAFEVRRRESVQELYAGESLLPT